MVTHLQPAMRAGVVPVGIVAVGVGVIVGAHHGTR